MKNNVVDMVPVMLRSRPEVLCVNDNEPFLREGNVIDISAILEETKKSMAVFGFLNPWLRSIAD